MIRNPPVRCRNSRQLGLRQLGCTEKRLGNGRVAFGDRQSTGTRQPILRCASQVEHSCFGSVVSNRLEDINGFADVQVEGLSKIISLRRPGTLIDPGGAIRRDEFVNARRIEQVTSHAPAGTVWRCSSPTSLAAEALRRASGQ